MSPPKVIIADDEQELRSFLKRQLAEVWPELTICAEAVDGPSALQLIRSHQPDIVFLDIHMPGLTGMEVARQIDANCRIVFITAYDQYAVEAFEAEAVDYLLKPVSRQRMEITVKRLKHQLAKAPPSSSETTAALQRLMEKLAIEKPPVYLQWLRVSKNNSIQLLAVQEVSYFKARDKYTSVITASGEALIKKPIKELAAELDPKIFWRIHRATIVNVACIDSVSRSVTGRYILRLKQPPDTLTVSRTYAHLFKQM